MMPRENLVGVIPWSGEDEVVLIEFLGEGAQQVVYAAGRLKDLSPTGQVVKFLKPRPFLEMDCLHYSLRIHESAYPNHPLRMSAAERMERLTAEMVARIQSERMVFRVEPYHDILEASVEVIAGECSAQFRAKTLGPHFLDDVPAIKGLVDESLLYYITELLDGDLILEEHRELFELVAGQMEPTIERWKASGEYNPFSKNPLFNLFGVFLEDFVNKEELKQIVKSKVFSAMVLPGNLKNFFDLTAILHQRAKPTLENPRKTDASKGDAGKGDLPVPIETALEACDFLDYCANRREWKSRHYSGLAKYWKARTCYLHEDLKEQGSRLLEAALEVLDEPCSLGDRHDALLDVLTFEESVLSRKRISEIQREIQRIEEALGVANGP